jgi:hypothetical protein
MQASRQAAPFQVQFSGNKGSRDSNCLGLLHSMVLVLVNPDVLRVMGRRLFIVVAYIYVLPAIITIAYKWT